MANREVFLVMTTSINNNKYYHMIDNEDGTFSVNYGRVGTPGQWHKYPISQWGSKYRSKVAKGYEDHTSERLVKKTKAEIKSQVPEYKPIEEPSIEEVINFLLACADKTVQSNYRVSSIEVTPQMVAAAQAQINQIAAFATASGSDRYAVDQFNEMLLKLFMTIPRKMKVVNDYLATNIGDFGKILVREQDLLDVMAGQVVAPKDDEPEEVAAGSEPEHTILEAMGITMRPVKPAEKEKILKLLEGNADLYFNAWAVTNKATQEKYDDFIDSHRTSTGRKMRTKLLWHGSRNENWISILKSGLLLRPNAVITGKMFGDGVYFAPLAKKSLGYTSLSGSYWAHGGSNRAFMAVFETAYGTPWNVYDTMGGIFHHFGYKELQDHSAGASCVHAHAGRALYNDEIIYYREDQMTVKYLVELRRK